MSSKKVVIVSMARTPIGSFMGGLSSVSATDLGAAAIKGAMEKINLDPATVNEVLMGNVVVENLKILGKGLGAGLLGLSNVHYLLVLLLFHFGLYI